MGKIIKKPIDESENYFRLHLKLLLIDKNNSELQQNFVREVEPWVSKYLQPKRKIIHENNALDVEPA